MFAMSSLCFHVSSTLSTPISHLWRAPRGIFLGRKVSSALHSRYRHKFLTLRPRLFLLPLAPPKCFFLQCSRTEPPVRMTFYTILYNFCVLDSRLCSGWRTLYPSSICWRSRFALSTLPSIQTVLALAYWIIILSASDYSWTFWRLRAWIHGGKVHTPITSATLSDVDLSYSHIICSFLENQIPHSPSVLISSKLFDYFGFVFCTKDCTHTNYHTLGSLLALGIATTRPWAPGVVMAVHGRSSGQHLVVVCTWI